MEVTEQRTPETAGRGDAVASQQNTSAVADAAGQPVPESAGQVAPAPENIALSTSEKRTYDKIRCKVLEAVSGKVPPRLLKASELLLTLPDFAALIFRLMKDPRVPAKAKVKLGLFAAYLVSPVDLVPDFIPIVGQMDDLVGAVIVVRDLLTSVPTEVVLSHWSGDKDIIGLIQTVLDVAAEVLSKNVFRALLRKFAR